MFHADFCRALGIRLEDGVKSGLGGIVGGTVVPMYFHRIKILVGSSQLTTFAGFSAHMAVAGLLGRRGFFENYIVKIDSSTRPPSFELDRVNRS